MKKSLILKIGGVNLLLLIILGILSLLSLAIGSANFSIPEILDGLFSSEDKMVKIIIYNLRLPRILIAILVGSALSVSGALLQAVMRNPLADPGIIGVSAGAGTAATTILLLFPLATNSVPIYAFAGAALASFLIYTIAYKQGISPVRIILSGVAINSVLGGYNAMLQLLYSDSLQGVLSFMNGSLASKSYYDVKVLSIYVGIGIILAFGCIKYANALQLGEDMASNLGINVNFARIFLSLVAAFLAASTVSVVGMVGFIGLVVPHIARMIIGSDYKALLPTSIILGSLVALFADTIGRNVIAGMEIPLGIVMSVVGGPFFLYMLRKRGRISAN